MTIYLVQHYKPVDHYGGEPAFKTINESDNFKKDYCKEKGIKLLEITYKDYKNIKEILTNTLL